MKAYIAGKLRTEQDRVILEKIDLMCKNMGIDTFLPHRDVGLGKGIKDAKNIFEGDITEGFRDCNIIVASLEGLHIGAGTAWELGYAYAKKIPAVGLKLDESVEEAFEYLSAIIVASMPIVSSFEQLEKELKKLIKRFS